MNDSLKGSIQGVIWSMAGAVLGFLNASVWFNKIVDNPSLSNPGLIAGLVFFFVTMSVISAVFVVLNGTDVVAYKVARRIAYLEEELKKPSAPNP